VSNACAWMAAHACGTAQIPADAAPRGTPAAWLPAPKPAKAKPPKRGLSKRPRQQLIDAIDDEWRTAWALSIRGGVRLSTAYAHLANFVAASLAEVREVPWAKGVRREYRRAR